MHSTTLPAFDLAQVKNPRALIRSGNLLALSLVVGLGSWVTFAPLNGAVIAPGFVKVDMNRKTVQHQEGGLVQELLVRDGDHVEAGQPLLILKDVKVDATQDLFRTQLDSELAKAARLDAERTGQDAINFPAELGERAREARVAELLTREQAVFTAKRESMQEQLALIAAQARDIEAEVHARARQASSDQRSLSLQEQEIAANEAMVAKGYVSKSRLSELKRMASDYESRQSQNQAQLAQSRQRAAELRLRAAALRTNYMREAAEEHKQAVATVFDLRERLRPWVDARERQVVTAPVSGEVVNLRVSSPGAVIGPRDAILDIVPHEADLVVESKIRPEDINSVHAGALADVRLTSFKQRITPMVAAEVVYVSADRLEDQATGAPYYQAHVKVTRAALHAAGINKLQAGLPAEVFVKTGERTALGYFLEPVTGFLSHALREP